MSKSNWIDKTETILKQIKSSNGIPYKFERFDDTNKQLPDTYIVYFLVDDVGKTFTDGKETSHEPRIQVSLYYREKTTYLTIPDVIKTAFIADGFTRGSEGRIPYQESTGHYGWRCDFYLYERR